jgi:hypothetical protein
MDPMNSTTAPVLAVLSGLVIGHAAVAATNAIDAHLSYNACLSEQNVAGFGRDHALKWCSDRLK